uniref:hypothetical protein n=1 Tax=Shewanella sp. TaxID=50422 RepID=UPI0040483A93
MVGKTHVEYRLAQINTESFEAYLVNQPNDEQAKRWLAGVDIKIQRAGLTPDDTNGAE